MFSSMLPLTSRQPRDGNSIVGSHMGSMKNVSSCREMFGVAMYQRDEVRIMMRNEKNSLKFEFV